MSATSTETIVKQRYRQGARERVPEALRADPELWSGCVSGALTEEDFLAAFERAGFRPR